jgi:hypothetical protein
LAPTNGKGTPRDVNRSVDEFLHALSDVLTEVTALEVNTMVVEHITGDKFVPWETYRDIYPISEEYLEQQGIHESLRDRYLEFRKTLELEYALLSSDPTSKLYDPEGTSDRPILTEPNVELRQLPTHLPNPLSPTNSEEMLEVRRVLRNSRFRRSLRKISELKTALDNRNKVLLAQPADSGESSRQPQKVKTDIIYAQTVLQLDGDIINRYAREILESPYRETILHVHQTGVNAGEKQWRGLLELMIGIVQSSLPRGKRGKRSRHSKQIQG